MSAVSWQALGEPAGVAESPFWHPHELCLYWVDIAGREIRRANPFMGTVERWSMPQEPGCIAPARSGGLVIALRDGVYRAREWGGELRLLAPALHDTARQRFNDGKCDASGRFWAGTLNEARDRADAALYCLDLAAPTPLLREMARDATVGNGLAWSPAGDTLYWADTTAHAVRAWRFEAEGPALRDGRVWHEFARKPAGWSAEAALAPDSPRYGGRPDGAAVDAEGHYWVAMYEGACLARLDPAGRVVRTLAAPVRCPTMPCFGGDDLRTLYLTTARHGRPAAELAREPLAGCVFHTRVEVPGLPVNFLAD